MKRKTDNFEKFYNRKSNSAIKEGIKQEKKREKKRRGRAMTVFTRRKENSVRPGRNQIRVR